MARILVAVAKVSVVCLRWLEEDLDRGDPDIAAFAGEAGLSVFEIAPTFERILKSLIGRPVGRKESLLRALRLYLALALEGDLMEWVQQVLHRFRGLSKQRLVNNPRRSHDQQDEVYAEQELRLEYIYGSFYRFDDLQDLSAHDQEIAKAELSQNLRNDVTELEKHLAARLAQYR